jgi:hypothetical protein
MKSVRHLMLKFKNKSSRPTLILVGVVVLSIIGLVIDASRIPKSNSQRPSLASTPLTAVSPAQPITEAEAKKLARQERSIRMAIQYERILSLAKELKFNDSGGIVTFSKDQSELTLTFPYLNRRLVDTMSTEHHFLASLRGYGFKTITFTDGKNSTWTFDFIESHWR